MKKAADFLEEKKEEILEAWIGKIKQEVEATRQNNELALRDHVPQLIEDIVKIIRQCYEQDVLEEEAVYKIIFENSIEHGRHRATSTGYTVDQILREYIFFHRILTNTLVKENLYDSDVGLVINYSIETAMLYSGSAFSESIQEMRQKLIGILAHDMRNPIAAAHLAIDIMKYDDGKERFEKVRKMALSSLKRSIDLVEGLLDSITVEAGEGITLEFSEINIVQSIQSIHCEASEIYSNEILLDCETKEITGVLDGTMIRRVLENFLSNAVKYGARGKPITIQVNDGEPYLEIKVHNHGNPIPDERKDDIFRFMKTQGNSGPKELKSWGMGLTLVKAVAEAHGGELNLESSEEKGTSFCIILNKYLNKPGKMRAPINYEFHHKK